MLSTQTCQVLKRDGLIAEELVAVLAAHRLYLTEVIVYLVEGQD